MAYKGTTGDLQPLGHGSGFMKKADNHQVDFMGAIGLRNEVYEEKEALILEKEELEKHMQALVLEKNELLQQIGENSRHTTFVKTVCRGMHQRIVKEGLEKKMMRMTIISLAGLLVAIMFGVLLKS